MAVDGIGATVSGIPDVKAALSAIPAKLRKKALRDALRAGARLVQREARRLAPVIKLSTYSGASAVRRGVRAVGTVRKAISVRTSRQAARKGDVGVFVNVRPARAGQRGAKNPKDPFYFRWINWGWNPASGPQRSSNPSKRQRRAISAAGGDKVKQGARFLEGGARMLGQALKVFTEQIGPRIAKLNQGKNAEP